MTQAAPFVPANKFREPFVGHLPGYLAANQETAPGPPDPDTYNRYLMERWQALLDSDDSRDGRLLHGS